MPSLRRGLVTLSLLFAGSLLFAQDNQLTPPKEGSTPVELLQFINRANRPNLTKTDFELLIKVADQVASHEKATDEEKTHARRAKVSVLFQASRRMNSDFGEAFEKYTSELAKDKDPELAGMAVCFRWAGKYMTNEGKVNMEGKDELIAICKNHPKHALVGSLVGVFAEQFNNDREAVAFLREVEALVGDSPIRERIEGLIKNKSILGNVMELSGPTLDGTDFNLASYKGKVVLVDFWATWCGPCIAELPTVKAVYEKYRDKGFEVVAVSLDFNKEALKKYVEEKQLPWKQIIFSKEDEMGWNNPLAKKFGISGIPAMFLVGKDGVVVTRELRGEGVLEKMVAAELEKPGK